MKRALSTVAVAAAVLVSGVTAANAEETSGWDSGIPGQSTSRQDADGNGSPDAGVIVTGHYNEWYSYDANGDYYWDRNFGKVLGTVGSVEELDQATATTCTYQVNFRGDFQNDPYQDNGWISNQILCKGYEAGAFTYQIVHKTSPRYTGLGTPIWGDWEQQVTTVSGSGNIERVPEPR